MRRWNAWGNHDSEYTTELTENLREVLQALVGPSRALPVASLEDVVASVPASRLPEHPLFNTDPEVRTRHARGQSFPDSLVMQSGEFGVFPDGVAFPESTEQVVDILRYCAQNKITVIPYGGGTSVAGHINPAAGERPVLTLSMAHMNTLLGIDEESQIARFGAGTSGPLIEAQLKPLGFTLGHYPQSWELSTVGGWVASRSSGQQSLRYGRIEQLFAGGTVATHQGVLEIPTIPASSAGPDLREMIMGSEGRFGVITEVAVRVNRLPEHESFHVIFFPSWTEGMATAKTLVQDKTPLSMIRLSNQMETLSLLHMGNDAEQVSALESELAGQGIADSKVMLTVGVTGNSLQCEASLAQLRAVCNRHGGYFAGSEFGERWAHGRFRAPYLREALAAGGYAVDTMETAVEWRKVETAMNDIERAIREALADEGEQVHVYTHLSHVYGQGSSIYSTYLFRYDDSYQKTHKRWQKLKKAGAHQIVASGGTISHHHGVGVDHKPYLHAEKGPVGLATIAALCNFFDPDGLMNPGKLVDSGAE